MGKRVPSKLGLNNKCFGNETDIEQSSHSHALLRKFRKWEKEIPFVVPLTMLCLPFLFYA